jgi:hypothetical protein
LGIPIECSVLQVLQSASSAFAGALSDRGDPDSFAPAPG